jgi:hypothetical protein
MTVTVSLCEQQSAAIYIHCVIVYVSSVKKATNIRPLVSLYISSVRLHVTNGEILKKVSLNI